MGKEALIFFFRTPARGCVKRRLEKGLGKDIVFQLYNAFVLDLIETCKETGFDTILSFQADSATDASASLTSLNHNSSMQFRQYGYDIGQRMFNAMSDAYRLGYSQCVLIGSDVPDISMSLIKTAFEKLSENDFVIGPSLDGGYYLIGGHADKNDPGVFSGIPWSTDEVLNITAGKVCDAGHTYCLLEPMRDIDEPEDLKSFFERNRASTHVPHTINVIIKEELYEKIRL